MNVGSKDKSEDKVDGKVRARRYALKYNPPSVVLEYADSVKTRLRTVKLLELNATSDVERLTSKVIRSFPRQLDRRTVNREQVKRLVVRLVEKAKNGATVDLTDPNVDLNKVSQTELKQAKEIMDEKFLENQKLPGQDGFEYDVQKNFAPAEEPNEWDSSDDEAYGSDDEFAI
ncbi:hypothetical protein CYMTET_56230 [Cymbomonas tetramitiformis]|uniref:Centrosomal protein of 19 kDa n=1 Tax=Cymbomonas tetramitiformis TaxID=36881 RepID=A0AAE0EM62_9CHLO|nr:hypothetical protein CYMTET_56230 [Cymbomonas tetramitiformis]